MKSRSITYTYRNVDNRDAADELAVKMRAAGQEEGAIPVSDIDGDLLVGWSAPRFDQMYDAKAR